jgi:F-type H+-transporting ATPase subunit alpha
MPVAQQVVSIWAGTTGQLDEVPIEDVRRFEAEFLDFMRREHRDVLDSIAESGKLSDESEAAIKDAIGAFKGQFVTAAGHPLVKDEPVKPLGEDEEEETAIRIHKPSQSEIREKARPDAGE